MKEPGHANKKTQAFFLSEKLPKAASPTNQPPKIGHHGVPEKAGHKKRGLPADPFFYVVAVDLSATKHKA
ncbi:hypothetical protein GCM10011405_35770 [Rufibacter glacialis]|nr:hypothetical protein GCM10011405_35770 [Rufibacter glacialis]